MINFTKLVFVCVIALSIANINGSSDRDDTDFVCSSQGRHLDTTDKSCCSYHLCIPGENGRWSRTTYQCPGKTIFDTAIGHCSSSGECRIPDSSSSSESFDGDEFVCKSAGIHDNPNDPNCASYYECKKTHKGDFFAIEVPCPLGSRFDPHNQHCSAKYTCPRKFTCHRVGRFANLLDSYNKEYILCVQKKNGEFVQTKYSCPKCSRFDSELEMCKALGNQCDPNEEEHHDYSLPIENWDRVNNYVCKARGYFKNKDDKDCHSYQFCDVMADGKLVGYTLPCPAGYLWNDDINLCKKNN